MLSRAKLEYASFGAMSRRIASELLVYAAAAIAAGSLFVASAALYVYVWPGKSVSPLPPPTPEFEAPAPMVPTAPTLPTQTPLERAAVASTKVPAEPTQNVKDAIEAIVLMCVAG